MLSRVSLHIKLSIVLASLLIFIHPSIGMAQENQVYVVNGAHQDIGISITDSQYVNQLKDHIELIERYPDVRYSLGNTVHLKQFLLVYPEYENRLKSLMRQGKISAPAEWVAFEPDWYSGEYLVRSVAYTKYWLKSALGYDSHWAHLNDVPSITPQFIQILKKSAVELLVGNSNRLGWPPVGNPFYYGALDGSRILTYATGYNTLLYLGSELRLDYLIDEIKLNKNFGPQKLKLEQAISDWGTAANLSLGLLRNCQKWNRKYARQYNFSLNFKTIEDFAGEINKRITDKGIKLSEISGTIDPWPWSAQFRGREASYYRAATGSMLPTVEKLSAICRLLGGSAYPTDKINQAWEHIMWTTDHNWGWNDKKRASNKAAYDIAQKLIKQKMAELASQVKWEARGIPVVVFNPLNWSRSEAVELSAKLDEKLDWAMMDHAGVPVLSQELRSQSNGDGTKTVRLLFWAANVPSIGYKTFYIVDKNRLELPMATDLRAGDGYIENKYYKISANPKRGLTSIYDKLKKRELINTKSDYPFGFLGLTRYTLGKKPVHIKQIESHNGSVKAELKLAGKLFDYPVTIQLILWPDSPRINIDILMDYSIAKPDERYEKKKHFYVHGNFHAFITPFNLPDYSMQLGIPYGAIPNLKPTSLTSDKLSKRAPSATQIVGGMYGKKGRFEFSNWHKDIQKWFSMGNAAYSIDVALINLETRTYMFNMDKKLPAISLLRGVKPYKYNWQLALRGHPGDWRQADSPRFGWEASNPLLAAIPTGKGKLPPAAGFITVFAPEGNIVLSTFKQAFDGNGYVLRFYETEDHDTQVKLSVNPLLKMPEAEVSRTNLLETPYEVLPAAAKIYAIPTKGFGIETVRFFKTAVTDITAPAAITDLKLINPSSAGFDLEWSASGDDKQKGTAHEYQIAYFTQPINEQNWDMAPKAKRPPQPKASGAKESFRVFGLNPRTKYYFAIKVADAEGNQSAISNIAHGYTQKPDNIPPAAISDLSITRTGATTITLSWTAPGDDKFEGQASHYDLRYADEMLDATTWEDAVPVDQNLSPGASKSQEKYSITGLKSGVTYYFAIKSGDEAGNFSSISNIASGQTGSFKQLVLQNGLNGYSGCSDTYISRVNEEESVMVYGNSQTIRTWAGGARSVLLNFDLSAIPNQALIHSATLGLYSYDITYGDEGNVQCYRLTTAWDQSQANWRQADKKHKWNKRGGGQIDQATDYGFGPNGIIAKQQVKDGGQWLRFPVTSVIQDWMAGKYPNYGWLIKGDCKENCGMYYHSSEYRQQPELRPMLEIKYDLTATEK